MQAMRRTGRRRTGVIVGILACALALSDAGCSFIFVEPPPKQPVPAQSLDCTTNSVAPIADSVLAALGGLFTLAVTSICIDTCGENQNLKRAALALPFFVLPVGSAIYGYSKVGSCRDAHRGP